jgi:hypothetical protein
MASYQSHSSPGAFASQTKNYQQTFSSEPSAFPSKKAQLQVKLEPSDYSVVCGRGLETFNHVGNRRFRILIRKSIERYSQADTRTAKSVIVSEIIALIRRAGGIFCKYKKGVWLEVGPRHAREKVGASLRDLLHTQYRSSSKARAGRQRNRKTLKQQQNQNRLSERKRVDDSQPLDDSSTTSSCWGRSKDSLGFEYWLEEKYFEIDVF